MDLIDNCARSRGKLNRNSYCSWSHSNPTNSNQWMERKRRRWRVSGVCGCGGCWEGIGDGLSMFVLVLFLSLFMVLYLMCFFDFDFSGGYVIELFGNSIATLPISECKSPHHDHRGICFLPWKMVVCSGLTVFSGTYPVRYECHESTVWVELQHVLLEPWIAKRGKNRSCRCVLQWFWMGVCLNEWVAYHMEREQTVNVDGMKRTMSWWDFNCK